MNIKEIIYGKDVWYLMIEDEVLKYFDTTDSIKREIIKDLKEIDMIMDLLAEGGFIEIRNQPTYTLYKITIKGKMKRKRGGFMQERLYRRIGSIIIFIGSILTILDFIFK